jgi:hypothetical protein
MIEWLIAAGVAYVAADYASAVYFGRCVLPGLKCRECRGDDD